MPKRLFLFIAVLLLVCGAQAAAPLIDAVHVDPTEVPAQRPTEVLFTAHVYSDAQHILESVHLLRLQWSGSELAVSKMWDNGTHGDQKSKDGTYSCSLKLKEGVIGLLSFRIEAKYKKVRTPVDSQAIFVKVVGGS